ncbi:MAG: hypothetical protein ACE5Q6_00590 [Dehalococcoidia bacterium]
MSAPQVGPTTSILTPQPVAIIVTAGQHEFETSDGDTRIIGPGSIVLCEDTTGKGHRARDLGQREAQAVLVWYVLNKSE